MIVSFIRHGEEPPPGSGYTDMTYTITDKESLSKVGWNRAKNIVTVAFNPTHIFTCSGGSKRAAETISFLAKAKGITPKVFNQANTSAVASAINALPDNSRVLVCWEHKLLVKIVSALGGKQTPKPPKKWAKTDYGSCWELTGGRVSKKWTFRKYTYGK